VSAGHVLLVDDDADFLKLLSTRLERDDFRVTTAESGEKALALLQNTVPDVVVTDLRMEGMDGIALLDRLQHDHPSLPVLIITAHGTIPEAVTATQRGAVGFITKPIDHEKRSIFCTFSLVLSFAYAQSPPRLHLPSHLRLFIRRAKFFPVVRRLQCKLKSATITPLVTTTRFA